MWGCGNGVDWALADPYTPKHIQGFEGQKVASVSCGNSHTLVTTVIKEVYRGEGTARVKVKVGGDCYQAGPQNVCGKFCPSFVLVPGLADLSIACISAGFNHSAVTTTSGEIFCWGNNYTGCCGALPHVRFCYEPHNIRCVYERPVNIALGRNAQMSSVYNGRGAYLAVDGNLDGDMEEFCCSTQSESQPWFEIDLGEFAIIQTVKIWNRNESRLIRPLTGTCFVSGSFRVISSFRRCLYHRTGKWGRTRKLDPPSRAAEQICKPALTSASRA